jgi:membrane protease YdiL (CAAX protease family)
MELKRLAGERPLIFTLILIGVLTVTSLIASLIIYLFRLSGEIVQVYRVFIEDIMRGVVAVLLLTRMDWWRAVGYNPGHPADLKLFWLALVPVIINLTIGVRAAAFSNVILFLFIALLIGFVEETYFRGLMLHALVSQGVWRAAVITAVFFGLLHMLNIFAGWNPQYVFQQVLYATALGFMYAALAIRTGIIWPLVLTHAGTDFAAFLAVGNLQPPQSAPGGISAIDVFAWLIFIGYGVFLLARSRRDIDNISVQF